MALCPVKRDGMKGELAKIRENSFDFHCDVLSSLFFLFVKERERQREKFGFDFTGR